MLKLNILIYLCIAAFFVQFENLVFFGKTMLYLISTILIIVPHLNFTGMTFFTDCMKNKSMRHTERPISY